MHILIAGQTFYRKNNGQAVFTINLAEGLAQAGHQVLVIGPSDMGRAYRKSFNSLTLQTVPTLPLNQSVNITAFSKRIIEQTLAEFNPDVVHIQDHYFISRAVMRATRREDLVRVGTNHFLPDNLTYNLWIPAWAQPPLHRLLWNNMLEVFQKLHAATTPTETAVRILRQQGLEIPLQAISCGINPHRFKPRPHLNRTKMRQRYGLDPQKTLFLCWSG